jgi:hypothetical protein
MLSFSNTAFNPSAPRGGVDLSFANFGTPSASSIPRVSDFLPATNAGASGGTAAGVNTTQIDGQTGFFEALSGFGSALLSGIGVRPEPQPMQAQPVGLFTRDEPQGVSVEQIAILGLVAGGLYFAFKG